MKKALVPLLLIVLVIALLIGAMAWYEHHYGSEGPFPNEHHHSH